MRNKQTIRTYGVKTGEIASMLAEEAGLPNAMTYANFKTRCWDIYREEKRIEQNKVFSVSLPNLDNYTVLTSHNGVSIPEGIEEKVQRISV